MKKIVFGITSLTLGGAERVLVDIVNELKTKYEITIFTLYDDGEFKKELDKEINVISVFKKPYRNLNFIQKKYMSLCMVSKTLRTLLFNKYIKNKFDIEIAFLEGPITWIFSSNSNSKKIAWVHNDIKQVFGQNNKTNIKQKLNNRSYDKYDELVFVSEDNLKAFNETLSIDIDKKIIHNYINSNKVIEKSVMFKPKEYDNKDIKFVVVCRLTSQKGVDRLINVHDKLVKLYSHQIYVIGDGPLRESLQNQIEYLGLKDTFHLLGKRENPYPYIKNANYFMLPSIYEGYGMVIEEAKILSKYIIITNTAAREAVINYEDSIIVDNNSEGIYKGMEKVIKNKVMPKNKNKFNNKQIIKDIIKVVEE